MASSYEPSKGKPEINLQLLINRLLEEQLQPMSHQKIVQVLQELIQEQAIK